MSKSRGNVVNPNDVIGEWGGDSLRLYEMFLGPLEQVKPWQTKAISGVHRFIKRVWRIAVKEDSSIASFSEPSCEHSAIKKSIHQLVQKVTDNTEKMQFNLAIASMMEFINTVYKHKNISRETYEKFLCLLAPYAPHVCEELWELLGNKDFICKKNWPSYDASQITEDLITIAVMINGKTKATLEVDKSLSKDDIIKKASENSSIKRSLEGKKIKKEIYVPGKVVNFVL